MKYLVAALIVSALLVTSAQAGFNTGNSLVIEMREYEKSESGIDDVSWFKVGVFQGYLIGVWDANDFMFAFKEHQTKGQTVAVAAKYINEHPERWHEPAEDLVLDAFIQAFPLKDKYKHLRAD